MKRKILFTILFALLISMLIPTVALAATIDVDTADSPFDLSTVGTNNNVRVLQDAVVTLTKSAPSDTMIICQSGVTLTLNGVNVSCTSDFKYALSFTGGGNTLILSGTNDISSGYFVPGVMVDRTTELTIREDEAVGGTLNANGGGGGAGIGGPNNYNGGIITIDSGTINAIGGRFASGIGGGHSGDGGVITINGGTVTAKGGDAGGAGIGGGAGGSEGTITITGGTVYTTGDVLGGAQDIGIGNGGSPSGTLTISGDAKVFLANESAMTPQSPTPQYIVQYTAINNAGEMPTGYTMPVGTVFPVGMFQVVPAPVPTPTPTLGVPERVENPETGYFSP